MTQENIFYLDIFIIRKQNVNASLLGCDRFLMFLIPSSTFLFSIEIYVN